MAVGELCTRDIITVRRGEPLSVAAQEMVNHHVGAIVVVDDYGGVSSPIGIFTDRDILKAQLRHGADLHHIAIEQVMARDPLCLKERDSLATALERMQARAVRRAPVVNESGALVGILAFDDLILVLAAQVTALAKLIERQQSLAEDVFPRPSVQAASADPASPRPISTE